MENTKETKELVVGANTFVVRTYLTGREVRNIQSAMMSSLEMKQKNGEAEITGFKGEMLALQEDKQIQTVVVSVNGSTDNILNFVLDLPKEEYDQVVAYVKEVSEGKKQASN